ELAHVAHVEEPNGRAHAPVLLDDARILDGHFPATELDHPSAGLHVSGVEGRSLQRGVHGRLSRPSRAGWGQGQAAPRGILLAVVFSQRNDSLCITTVASAHSKVSGSFSWRTPTTSATFSRCFSGRKAPRSRPPVRAAPPSKPPPAGTSTCC